MRHESALVEPMRRKNRLNGMTRIHALAALILATFLSGCSTEQGGSGEAVDPVSVTPTTPADSQETTASTLSEEWVCSPGQMSVYITDPVVYSADLSLEEVASKLDDGKTFHIDSNTGRLASMTFRNEQGLIVRRLEFERSESVGWHIERGRAC